VIPNKIFSRFKWVIPVFITVLLVYALNNKFGNTPPLGKFLDPFHGYLALTGSDELPENELHFENLTDEVTVIWDDHRIPHIFAENDHDLFFTQGYIMAMDRLWQLDFQVRATAGRMSEIIGEKALVYDWFQRRIGLKHGAEKSLIAAENDPGTIAVLQAYSDGINAYIDQLPLDEYPMEYKILDYAPEYFSPFKVALLLKNMAWTLTGRSSDLPLTRTWNQFGREAVDELFPVMPYFLDPIISELPNVPAPKVQAPANIYQATAGEADLPFKPDKRNGSNNWAVSGKRTASGNPIIANDPHLTLTIPAIWYIMHLSSPERNVMGVTIPGAPGIISGFNDQIAWGVTNGNDDVMDWYDIQFKDNHKNEYLFDGEWKKTTRKIEEIRIRNGPTFQDTIIFTHHGPVVWDKINQVKDFSIGNMRNPTMQISTGRALRWRGHDGTEEIRSLLGMGKAKTYQEWVKSLDYFSCPGQNFVFVDTTGNIAMWHAGHPPMRWPEQGRFISDGTDPIYDWKEFVPLEHMPHELNPQRDFVSSANQNPYDSTYPLYLSDNYWMSWRGSRINELLKKTNDATIQDVALIQMDNESPMAKRALPVMIRELMMSELNPGMKEILDLLSQWDFNLDGNSWEASFFTLWFSKLEEYTWADELGEKSVDHNWPNSTEMMEILEMDINSHWLDNIHTAERETLEMLVIKAFNSAQADLSKKMGSDHTGWKWHDYRGTNIHHLAKIPGFGAEHLKTSGGRGVPNATRETFGPSWRYAAEMGNPVTAIGIYPGGQSGYPGSRHYDDFISKWVQGEYLSLQFENTADEIEGYSVQFKGLNR
jgi:penicillin amidase